MDIEHHQKILSECHERYEQQLAEREKQIVMLREALSRFYDSWINGYSVIETAAVEIAQEALAATADLSGLVLCDAEPVGDMRYSSDRRIPLYKAKEILK
jgi:hypothetical protein